jgi:hypothetical protein
MWIWIFIITAVLFWLFLTARYEAKRARKTTDRMGFLSEVPELNPEASTTESVVRTDADELPFEPSRATSQNHEYTVEWIDAGLVDGSWVDGFRSEGYGSVILKQGDEILWEKQVERPANAAVANDGRVSVEDRLFGSGLRSAFYVFDRDGSVAVQQRLAAKGLRSGITPDGSLAWVSTATSTIARDSRKLLLFSVPKRKLLFRRDELWGFPLSITARENELEVVTDRGTTYLLSEDGQILNEPEVEAEIEQREIMSGQPWLLLDVVGRRMAKLGNDICLPEHANELLDLLDQASKDVQDEQTLGRIERRRGEILLATGDKKEALMHFYLADAISREAEVKGIISRLEKELNGPG